MKYFLIIGISLIMLSCSSTNQSSYFGYNNNPKVEDRSNDEIEVYKTGNNTNYSSNDNNYIEPDYNKVTNVYVLPAGFYNPWDYPHYDYYGMGYSNFYWDNWRFRQWNYYNPYSYWGYNPYYYPHNYYEHHYYDNYYGNNYNSPAPKRKDYRDFGVSRGEFGSPSRNVTSSSSSRSSGNTNPTGSVRNVNSTDKRTTNVNDYNTPKPLQPDAQNRNTNSTTDNPRSSQRDGRDVNVRQSQPRVETPNKSNERTPSNSGSSSSPSRSNINSSSPPRSSEKSSESSGQRSR